jgi:hypothetical protein
MSDRAEPERWGAKAMIEEANDKARQGWARLAGFLLVFTNVTAMFAFWVRGEAIVGNDAARTAANMAASEGFFRLGLAFDLVTVVGLIPLVVGLYVVLKPIGRNLALLAAAWRLIESGILAGLTFASFTALTLLGGGSYIRTLDPGQVQDLIYTLLRVHTWGFQVAFLFLGLGQTLFSYLWWKSRFIPRWLAGLGIVASSIMTVVALGIIIWPGLYSLVTMAYMAPMGIYEIVLGLWLLILGIGPAPSAQ